MLSRQAGRLLLRCRRCTSCRNYFGGGGDHHRCQRQRTSSPLPPPPAPPAMASLSAGGGRGRGVGAVRTYAPSYRSSGAAAGGAVGGAGGGAGGDAAIAATATVVDSSGAASSSSDSDSASASVPSLISLGDVTARAREITARAPPPRRSRRGRRDDDISSSSYRLGSSAMSAGAASAAAAAAAAEVATPAAPIERMERTADQVRDATDAADALHVLTSGPGFEAALSALRGGEGKLTDGRERDGGAAAGEEEVEALHHAFLAVSSWLLSSVEAHAAAAAAASAALADAATATATATADRTADHPTSDAAAGSAAAATGNILPTPTTTDSDDLLDRAILKCITLTVRSTDLSLPLHLPLFRRLVRTIARHSSVTSHPADQILEVANLSKVALNPAYPPEAGLFEGAGAGAGVRVRDAQEGRGLRGVQGMQKNAEHLGHEQEERRAAGQEEEGPLVALVRRGLVREASDVVRAMKDEFGIYEVDVTTGMEVLAVLADGLGLKEADDMVRLDGVPPRDAVAAAASAASGAGPTFDPADAMDLVMLLRGPLLRQLDELSDRLLGQRSKRDFGADGAASGAEGTGAAHDGGGDADLDGFERDGGDLVGGANAGMVDLLERLADELDEDCDGGDDEEEEEGEGIAAMEFDDKEEMTAEQFTNDLEECVEYLIKAALEGSKLGDKGEGNSRDAGMGERATQSGRSMEGEEADSMTPAETRPSASSLREAFDVWADPNEDLPDWLHDGMVRELVRVRNGPAWDLPDVAEQLAGIGSSREALYTREYEKDILQQIMREEELCGDDYGEDEWSS